MADVSLVRNATLMLADNTLNGTIFLGNIKGENDHIRPKLMKQYFWEINGENETTHTQWGNIFGRH